jgi:hypothetical protein
MGETACAPSRRLREHRAPLIVHWQRGISSHGAIRRQFHHVIDVAPTLYDILRIEAPTHYRGRVQMPLHGISVAYTFDGDEPTPRTPNTSSWSAIVPSGSVAGRLLRDIPRTAISMPIDGSSITSTRTSRS